MTKLRHPIKIFVFCITLVLCVNIFVGNSDIMVHTNASTLTELQAKKKANDAKLATINSQISANKNNQAKEKQYQDSINQKIAVTEDNIRVIEEQINELEHDIEEKNASIAQQEIDIETGMDQFKKRMRAMYISGNDGVASVLAGSTDFYEFLSRMEFVKRIAKSDDEMIDNLNAQLAELKNSKKVLEDDKAENDASKAQLLSSKKELNDSYSKSAANLAAQEKEYKEYQANKAQIDKLDKEIENLIQDEIRKLAEQNNQYVGGKYLWPVPGYYYISSPYGMRGGRLHKGIDITGSNVNGKPIVAANAGKVIVAFNNDSKGYSYGKYVMIDHGGGNVTLYGHCSKLAVSVGQIVNRGDTIAYVGSTGDSTGPHLHFEIRINGQTVDPYPYVK